MGLGMLATYGFRFAQPWWLAAAVAAPPAAWLAWRSLKALGAVRRVTAIALRAVVILLLAAVLGRPEITRTYDRLALLVVIDRSESIPPELRPAAHGWLTAALAAKPPGDQIGVVDVAELANITRLPSTAADVPERSVTLTGLESRLAAGVEMAMAIAPPNACVRIILITDGNETAGDLKAVARVAAANRIPIDVLPLQYRHEREVIFRRLVAPSRAAPGQTIPLRMVLTSTHEAAGRLMLTVNGRQIDLDPTSEEMTAPVRLRAGTNVQTLSLPLAAAGVHELEARFLPDDAAQDRRAENNRASAVTFVAGAGHVLVVSSDPAEAAPLAQALQKARFDVREIPAQGLPANLSNLLAADAVVLVNTDVGNFTQAQQEMLCRYVTDLGGGLVMVGGPDAFGAGGWIGSPVARILPVDMDPPQKKQMPKGALVLIMHACEMPQGNFWGKEVAVAAVKTLSRHDLIGVLDFSWGAGSANWVYPLSEAGDKQAVIARIKQMQMGDMPDFGPPVSAACQALSAARAGQKHIIIISDGDPTVPGDDVLAKLKAAGITCTGVAVYPHSDRDVQSLQYIAGKTGGRFYNVKNANELPQIFIKEAQVVRRSLIIEDTFTPRLADRSSEILGGIPATPALDGRVLAGPRGGLSQMLLATPDGEPVLAAVQAGLGRCIAFTSSADSRWAARWLAWGGFERLWEQALRWVGKSPQASDCEVFADVQGKDVTLTVESVQPGGKFVQLTDLGGQVIAPDMTARAMELRQVGPGQYRAGFRAEQGGSYLVNLRYRRGEAGDVYAMTQGVVTVPFAPEFEDLSDNSALLSELAAVTAGRVLPADPKKADLFRRAGLSPPRAAMPLTQLLLIAWVILFLLDVAVRRVALDFRAMARRAADWAASRLRRKAPASETLAALKTRRKSLRERLAPRPRDDLAARRYEPGAGAPAAGMDQLPQADLSPPPATRRAAPAPKEQPPSTAEQPQTHVSRLLQAKRRATGEKKQD